MALFYFIAGVLLGAAASRVALPLWRSVAALGRRHSSYVRVGALAASFALAAGILYLAIGSRHSLERPGMRGAASAGAAADARKDAASTAKSMDAEVTRLEARLAREGGTPAAGDLYVTSQVLRPAAGTRLALVINREIGLPLAG